MKKRRTFTSEFKSKVALEALREQQTIHEIAKRYQIHPSQVTEWKKTLLGQASAVFDKGKTHAAQEAHNKRKKEQLYKHIGQLKVEVDFLKTAVRSSVSLCRRSIMIEQSNKLSLSRQCRLLGVPRSSYYYRGNPQLLEEDELMMQAIDRIYTEEPAYGNRRMMDALRDLGYKVGRDKVRSLMSTMGIEAIYS